jgi:uncharacterized damage-inducible protein DinB
MATTLREYLLQAGEKRFRELVAAIEGLDEDTAVMDRRPDWPTHEYHVGQDGSIAGIVYHVAAWKQVYVELLRGKNTDQHEHKPDAPGYAGLVAWLKRAGGEWQAAWAALPESALETPLRVAGVSPGLTPLALMQEMYEHDIEHLGQINYLLEAQKCSPFADD